ESPFSLGFVFLAQIKEKIFTEFLDYINAMLVILNKFPT
ncbi:hypothetical protein J2S74_004892, partial [Evansella vedderi]|nr:hypothetical protein [Evansella vedderi]